MKIQIASDLHLEFLEKRIPGFIGLDSDPSVDVLVIAGDIHNGSLAISAFANWQTPTVLYVHGNHELYGHQIAEQIDDLRTSSKNTRVRYLECDEYRQENVRFLGCCLWTDHELYGEQRKYAAMSEARRALSDHKYILNGALPLSPNDARKIHVQSREWLKEKLSEPFNGKTVVITHHAPHPGSVHERFQDDWVNPAFVSDLTSLMAGVDLWIHGHTHNSFDYHVGRTRVIANPRGYPRGADPAGNGIEFENPDFNSRLIVEV